MPAGGASGSGESCESPAHLTSDRARSQWSRGRFFLTPESGGRYSRSLTARACAPWSMPSSSPQRIELCGVTVDVETDHADLARYLRGHFGQVQAPDATSATADVSVRVRWTEGPRETARPETVFPDWLVDTMIDRHVYVGPNRVVWLRVDDVPALALASEHGEIGRASCRERGESWGVEVE